MNLYVNFLEERPLLGSLLLLKKLKNSKFLGDRRLPHQNSVLVKLILFKCIFVRFGTIFHARKKTNTSLEHREVGH